MKRTVVFAGLAMLALAQPALAKGKPDPVAAAVADPARSEASRKLDEGRMPDKVLAFAGFKAGDAVADWGAGAAAVRAAGAKRWSVAACWPQSFSRPAVSSWISCASSDSSCCLSAPSGSSCHKGRA